MQHDVVLWAALFGRVHDVPLYVFRLAEADEEVRGPLQA